MPSTPQSRSKPTRDDNQSRTIRHGKLTSPVAPPPQPTDVFVVSSRGSTLLRATTTPQPHLKQLQHSIRPPEDFLQGSGRPGGHTEGRLCRQQRSQQG